MNNNQLLKIVEQYSRKSKTGDDAIKVMRVPDHKTVFVEQIDGVGRAIMMDKYEVDGATYWAGYSSRSETVYISLATQAALAQQG
jgi:meiotically up-regulated gene 157 (Mug157) protein